METQASARQGICLADSWIEVECGRLKCVHLAVTNSDATARQ